MNTTEEGDEPMGEFSELSIPRVVSLLDRQTQALNEIREIVCRGLPEGHPWDMTNNGIIRAILERNGIK